MFSSRRGRTISRGTAKAAAPGSFDEAICLDHHRLGRIAPPFRPAGKGDSYSPEWVLCYQPSPGDHVLTCHDVEMPAGLLCDRPLADDDASARGAEVARQ